MKIAFINIYQNFRTRGSERVIKELAKGLKEKGHSVDIISGKKLPPKNRWPILWRTYLDPQGLFIFFYTLKLLPKLFNNRYDVVIPANGGWQPALIRIITWLSKGRMVIIGHSGIGWDDRNNLWSFPDTFVALSGYAKDWAKLANPFVKTSYIPNGVDVSEFKPNGKKINLSLKPPVVLTVSALEEGKRLSLLIKAVAKINASLLIVGDGPLKNKLESLGKRLLGKRIKFSKFKFSQMPNVYRSADIFSLPSKSYYSFEVVILEAMASNMPVVVNKDPIRKSIVSEAGLLVDPAKTVEYSANLKKALNTKWGNKPRKQTLNYSWEKIVEKYNKLFTSLVNGKS